MHWIQRHILKSLAFTDSQRYTELKPDGVEGNLFQYHARELEKANLIVRHDSGYKLTPAGIDFVADLSQSRAMNRQLPPRVVVMIIAQNKMGEYLLFRWRRHPYRGQISFPFGRQLRGQTSAWVAADQLKWKTGYKAHLTYIGLVSLKTKTDHLLIQVYEASELQGKHGSDGLTGVSFWQDWAGVDAAKLYPGMVDILNWFESSHRPSLLELDV